MRLKLLTMALVLWATTGFAAPFVGQVTCDTNGEIIGNAVARESLLLVNTSSTITAYLAPSAAVAATDFPLLPGASITIATKTGGTIHSASFPWYCLTGSSTALLGFIEAAGSRTAP